MIRVLLGQRGVLDRGALAAVLSAECDMSVVAELDRTDDLLAVAARERANVAVLDGLLPGALTVAEVCRTLHRGRPACRPVVLLDSASAASLGRALIPMAPWLGLFGTDTGPAGLVQAVRRLANGLRVLDPAIATVARAAAENPLTDREREVLRLTGCGAPTKEIARSLGLRVGTVRNYLSRSRAKTGARTALEATRVAQDAGWI